MDGEVTPLVEAALAMREMFNSYVAAGFSAYEACVIIGTLIAHSPREGDVS